MRCPKCNHKERQNKDGLTGAGSQRYKCACCGKRYTPNQKRRGYAQSLRHQAVRMYADGLGFRQIARHLQVHHVSVMNWVKTYAGDLANAPMPDQVETVEMDELYTYVEKKKTGFTS